MDEETNVVPFPRELPDVSAPAVLWIMPANVEQARVALAHLELAAELCRRIIAKAPEPGEVVAVHGVRQVLEVLSTSLDEKIAG